MSHSRSHSVDTEMHELNQEADYLEEKTHIVPDTNGTKAELQRHNSDPDAQAMVIESLRSQIQDLFSQVSQLNGKLVRSYDRMSDLEDELHVTSANLRTSTLKISELELERSQHLSALSTGLLVEKDHVTTELNRLMEKATEEAAQRGQAESARAEIEKDLDDLSATLFNQANSMVAEARIGRARSERKAEETERALKQAEEVVGMLQEQMQALQAEKERADRMAEEMKVRMGKGKWVERAREPSQTRRPRLLCSHAPYQEYLSFISHLRTIRPASMHPPAMTTLLPLPFLARLNTEDSDPTVRLDLAPSLNWLSRRSVISAIHSGQLTVEPMATATLLEELAPSTTPGAHSTQISCALCGTSILPPASAESPTATTFPSSAAMTRHNTNSWSSSLFKTSIVQTISAASPGARAASPLPQPSSEAPALVYIFRLATTSSGLPVSLPLSSQQNSAQNRPTIYPLCTTKWCLARLRTTCSMWAFVRTCIVDKVWEESAYVPPPRYSPAGTVNGINGVEKHDIMNGAQNVEKKPVVPPRRSRMGIGAIWGSVQRSLSSSGKELEAELPKDAVKSQEKPLPKSPGHKFPAPPPVHPSLSAPAAARTSSAPPPLPPRNRGRDGKSKTLASAEEAHVDAPPSLTRLNSQDVFATPSEEPDAYLAPRASSPSAIPLPPSRNSSPEPTPLADPEQQRDHKSGEDPSADTRPGFLSSAVASRHVDGARNASPTPPPLPRRAAARLRPVSIVAPPPPEPASTEIQDANGTHLEGGEHGSDAVTHSGAATDPVPELSSETGATPADPPTSSEDVQPVVEAGTQSSLGEEQPLPTEQVANSGDVPEDSSQPIEKQELEQEQEHSTSQDTHEITEATPHADESGLPSAADIDAVDAAPSDEAHPDGAERSRSSSVAPSTSGILSHTPSQSDEDVAENPSALQQLSDGHVDSADDSADGEDGFYVSNATWEERTWKELARLREEMFWARIGGVR